MERPNDRCILCCIPPEIFNAQFPVETALSSDLPCPILPDFFNAHFPVQSARTAGLVPLLFLQKSSMHITLYSALPACVVSILLPPKSSIPNSLYRAPYQQVKSLSYSSRRLQLTGPCIKPHINQSSLCPIPPEDFNAPFPVQRALSGGLSRVLFIQISSMHILLYTEPYQQD